TLFRSNLRSHPRATAFAKSGSPVMPSDRSRPTTTSVTSELDVSTLTADSARLVAANWPPLPAMPLSLRRTFVFGDLPFWARRATGECWAMRRSPFEMRSLPGEVGGEGSGGPASPQCLVQRLAVRVLLEHRSGD